MISCILPTYNGKEYLSLSIESVLNQTYTDFELIIVDDCSNDGTSELIESYAQKDKRIRSYRNSENMKLPKSLNRGFSLARGDFLTWTSDDNIYSKDAFEKMINALSDDVGMVFSRMTLIDDKGNHIGDTEIVNDISNITYRNIVGACFLYRRCVYEAVGDYNEKMFLVEDWDYWLRIYRQFSIKYIPESLYMYRTHQKSLTMSRVLDVQRAKIQLMEKVLSYEDLEPECRAHIYAEMAEAYYVLTDVEKIRYYINCFEKLPRFDFDVSRRARRAARLGETFTKCYKKYKSFVKKIWR